MTQRHAAGLFVAAVFVSASLIFVLEPLIAKLLLPLLGGSAAVWNTSMVFFQAALLAGYAYAHALQRFASLPRQMLVHLAVLAAAAAVLPLRVWHVFGDPPPYAPVAWLLATLAVSIGAPFAALSATAPLLQAWRAKLAAQPDPGGADGETAASRSYGLYAASNLGSFFALLAYPVLIEPNLTLTLQRTAWTIGYVAFFTLIAAIALAAGRTRDFAGAAPRVAGEAAPISWSERAAWLLLAAAPSSLMLGLTTFLVTDVASAPFLWVVPLALYLLTFVIAFAPKRVVPYGWTLALQAVAAAFCIGVLPYAEFTPLLASFGLNLVAFFLTALLCHQTLAARRPPASRSTDFLLAVAAGGVIGGAFTALLAPVVFSGVIEYPLVLVLASLARPWGDRRSTTLERASLAAGLALALLAVLVQHPPPPLGPVLAKALAALHDLDPGNVARGLLLAAAPLGFFVRRRALFAMVLVATIGKSADAAASNDLAIARERGYFGVLELDRNRDETLGDVYVLYNGTTLHGAQSRAARYACRPMTYYARPTPLGQALVTLQRRRPALRIGVIGLGAGTMAAYVRAADRLTFFEINPQVLDFAYDPARFTYATGCAKTKPDVVLGDARLTLERRRGGEFDLLLVDAFSSDSIPTHLLTEEALRLYRRAIKPDGVVVLHLSNRNLEIERPAAAAARAIGAVPWQQNYEEPDEIPLLSVSSTNAIVFGRGALPRDFASTGWTPAQAQGVAPWTDDYTNVFGAFVRHFSE